MRRQRRRRGKNCPPPLSHYLPPRSRSLIRHLLAGSTTQYIRISNGIIRLVYDPSGDSIDSNRDNGDTPSSIPRSVRYNPISVLSVVQPGRKRKRRLSKHDNFSNDDDFAPAMSTNHLDTVRRSTSLPARRARHFSRAALFLAFSKPPGGDAAHNAHVDAHTTPSEFHAVPVAPNKSALRMQQQYPPPSDVARLPNASQACTNRQARLPFCPEQQMTEERAVTKIFIPRAFDRGRSKFRPPGRCKVPLGAVSGAASLEDRNANLISYPFRICFPLPRPLVSVSPFLS